MTIAAAQSHHSCRSSRRKFTRTALGYASLGSTDNGSCSCKDHPQESSDSPKAPNTVVAVVRVQRGPLKLPVFLCTMASKKTSVFSPFG